MARAKLRKALKNYATTQKTARAAGFSNTYSLACDGTNDYAATSGGIDQALLGAACSFSLWIKPNTSSTWETQLWLGDKTATSRNKWNLENYNDQWKFAQGGGGIYSWITVSSGAVSSDWQHVAITDTSTNDVDGTVKLYVNGTERASATGSAWGEVVFASYDYDVQIGKWGSGGDYLEGNADEYSFWSKELSSVEVTALYSSGPTNLAGSSGLVHWWRLGDINGASGTTVEDQVGSLDMTLYNGATYAEDVPS